MKNHFKALFLGCLAIPSLGLACNYDVGECYVRGEDEDGGSGGGTIIPTSAGSYGDVPLEPQSVRDSWNPCSSQAECTVTWKPGSNVCSQQGATGSCTTLYQGQHTTLDEAEEQCERSYGVGTDSGAQSCSSCQWAQSSTNNPCRKECEEQADACEAKCRKLPEDDKEARRKCWEACNNAYAKCIKKCKD